ncbi:MAG: hypothetical protein JSW28_03325 [Thermoplasmata archaeon]|nr:MAG: hypothetical protein JSW28_03325 [Thermoplasmata archaeon]
MRKRIVGILVCVLLIATATALVTPIPADWEEGDGHKMHYPQLPKDGGWDVEFAMSRLADDWLCTETGPVEDIHFWISWAGNLVQPIPVFTVRIHSDIPANLSNTSYSMPANDFLWQRDYYPGQYIIRDMPDNWQGWYDPSSGEFNLTDHFLWQQINIVDIEDPFIQEEGTIYWLEIDFWTLPFVGWKESGSDQFGDDAVFWYYNQWYEVRDPLDNTSIDLAFVITEEEPELTADIEIHPETLNLNSQGKWVECIIELPEPYDEADIDPDTVFLETDIPAENPVLTGQSLNVKFDRSDLQDKLSPGDDIILTVTGQLYGGTAFAGTDTMDVIDPP